jgi:hypothetical protein
MIDRSEALHRLTKENTFSEQFLLEFLSDLGLDYLRLKDALAEVNPASDSFARGTL